jgi:Zn-dependent protease with chaperone function
MARHGLSGLLPAGAWLLPALLFVLVVLVCAVRAGCSLARQLTASGRLAHQVQELAMGAPERLRLAASQAGLSGRVVLLDAPAAFSFVYGVLTPRVVVSRGLIQGVSARELRAVLEHERYHVCNLDPLKIVLVRLLTSAFFFLPVLESLRVRYVTARELAADRRAVAICGRPPLAGALLKVVRGPQWSEMEVAAPMGDPQLLSVRVAQLESGVQPELAKLGITRSTISLMGAALLIGGFLAAACGYGGPAAIHHATGTGPAGATLLDSLSCVPSVALAGLAAYLVIALCASRGVGPRVG